MTAERCQGDGFNIAQNEWWTIKKGRKGGCRPVEIFRAVKIFRSVEVPGLFKKRFLVSSK